jgi:glyoxylase-like metal-dependent hydrolase (beta-lactamase superfamily II)
MITEFYWINTGFTTGREWLTKGNYGLRRLIFPAYCGLLKDDQFGYILFDTGYGPFFQQATKKWPYRLYRWITPIHYNPDEDILAVMNRLGITPADIKYLILSHLHADHIGHLKSFPQAQIICHEEVMKLFDLTPFKQTRHGLLPALVPTDFKSKVEILENHQATRHPQFDYSWSLFDGCIEAVYLTGHALGQIGIRFNFRDHALFLVADASWFTSAIDDQTYPNRLVSMILPDWKAFKNTLANLHEFKRLNPDVMLIPTHCSERQVPNNLN